MAKPFNRLYPTETSLKAIMEQDRENKAKSKIIGTPQYTERKLRERFYKEMPYSGIYL